MPNEPQIPLVPPSGQIPSGGDPPGQTPPTPQGQTPSGRTHIGDLPQDIQDHIRALRAEAKGLREQVDAETSAKKRAEEQRLKQQGEFKQLADKHEARVKELEPIATSYTKLAEQLRASIRKETKDWPAEVKAFYPGDEASVEQLNEWFERSKPLIEKLQQQARGTLPGNRPNPAPAGQAQTREATVTANMADLKKQRTYGI